MYILYAYRLPVYIQGNSLYVYQCTYRPGIVLYVTSLSFSHWYTLSVTDKHEAWQLRRLAIQHNIIGTQSSCSLSLHHARSFSLHHPLAIGTSSITRPTWWQLTSYTARWRFAHLDSCYQQSRVQQRPNACDFKPLHCGITIPAFTQDMFIDQQ